jgi:hypothetical protein
MTPGKKYKRPAMQEGVVFDGHPLPHLRISCIISIAYLWLID